MRSSFVADARSERARTFDALHAERADPWNFETSSYEADKRDATIAALGGRRFSRGLEMGCSIGVLTERLSAICDELLAIDVSETALTRARNRSDLKGTVSFRQTEIPEQWPDGRYDLIVLSEILYFLSFEEIEATSRLAYRCLDRDGACLLVNWDGPTDLPVDGRQAVSTFVSGAAWTTAIGRRAPSYRIHLLQPKLDI